MYIHMDILLTCFSFAAVLFCVFKVPPSEELLDEPSLTVSSGQSVSVEGSLGCGGLCPTARVSWFDKNRNEITDDNTDDVYQRGPISGRKSTLEINSADTANTGEYFCRARISEEEMTYTNFTIILQS